MTDVQRERLTGRPLVVGIVAPTARMRVASVSQHHVTIEVGDQRVIDHPNLPRLDGLDVPVQIVLSRQNAGQLIEAIMQGLTSGEVDVDALVHDLNCPCGDCPPRPVGR